MKIIVIGAKPATREELEQIYLHDEIEFLEDVEEYRALYGTKPTLVVIDDVEAALEPGSTVTGRLPRVHVGSLGHWPRSWGKSGLIELLMRIDYAKLEERIVARPDVVLDGPYGFDLKTIAKNLATAYEPLPVKAQHDCRTGRGRQSKGDRHANKRHRWSGQ